MLRRISSVLTCGYEPVCIGGYWTFMPIFCSQTKRARKIVSHRKRNR